MKVAPDNCKEIGKVELGGRGGRGKGLSDHPHDIYTLLTYDSSLVSACVMLVEVLKKIVEHYWYSALNSLGHQRTHDKLASGISSLFVAAILKLFSSGFRTDFLNNLH